MKLRKVTGAVVAATLLVSSLSGCGGSKKASSDSDKLDLSMHMHFYNYCVFSDDWQVFKEAAEKTGVSIHGTAVETVSDSAQAFSTMLADKTLPDIIHYNSAELNKIGKDGALIPLEDLIDKYAPNIKKYFEECPEAKAAATASDGHIYNIPGTLAPIGEASLPSQVFFIRQDWLTKLGLEVPKTVEEYHDVLTAFRDKDPNGNGKKDEIPYFDREGTINNLYQLFGAHINGYIDESGEYRDGRIEDSFKTAISNLSKWYKEGLIDPEIFTRGQQAREQLLGSNLGGSTHDWFSSTSAYNDTYKDTGINFSIINPPADVNGKVKEDMGRPLLHGLGWGISRDNKEPERTMKYFDWWLSEEGIKLRSIGIEGKTYTNENGKIVFSNEALSADGGLPGYLRNQGCVEIGTVATLDAELSSVNDAAKQGFDNYKDSGFISKSLPTLTYTDEEQNFLNENSTNISTYISEQVQKWILGAEDVDATWDNYVKTLKSMKIDEEIKVNSDAYNRYKETINK